MVGDEFGEMLAQVGVPTGAMLADQPTIDEIADGSVEPATGGVHDHAGPIVVQFGDHHP